ncbi:hypothetical protein Pan153_48990 [Gimesia panareensis]|uniref:Uncharacterized protein n=1 Tax=Gimesia panareensis TaxID=2527978 RepID=A0A518FV54_9PLAN|nr:hypothetical protein [Gimesia panareensis]QDV20226.1 hypothetical protein Pan153_48990 [Gimesia panareensis]
MDETVRQVIRQLQDRIERITDILNLLDVDGNSEAELPRIRKRTHDLLIDLEIDAKSGVAVGKPLGIREVVQDDFVPPAYQAYWSLYFNLDLERSPTEGLWAAQLDQARTFLKSELLLIQNQYPDAE